MNNNDNQTPKQAKAPTKLIPMSEAFIEAWIEDIGKLPWVKGALDASSWMAFLKAATYGVDDDVALQEVARRIIAAGGRLDATKLKSQIRRANKRVEDNLGDYGDLPTVPKAEFSPDKLKKIAAQATGIDEAWLAGRSEMPPYQVSSEQFLNALYKPGEKVVLFNDFKSQGQQLYEVNPGSKIEEPLCGGPDGIWFLSNPVDGQEHPNPDLEDKLSRRSKESVTSWRYMVIESDVTDPKEWLACLVQLPLRIAAIYTSGGKSIHALVRIDASSKADWDTTCRKMKPILVTVGADGQAMTAVRLTRLPGTMRGDKPQQLLYINSSPEAQPILNMPVRKKETTATQEQQQC